MDTYDIKFLESPQNLIGELEKAFGRKLSTSNAIDIATCVQQGRMFFDAARTSPIEIRPLVLHYGVVAFSKAIAASRNMMSPATLAHSHGLSDVSSPIAKLEDASISVEPAGTFHDLNDALRPLERISFYDQTFSQEHLVKEPADARALDGQVISLREVLSRIPSLTDIYKKTFDEPARAQNVYISSTNSSITTISLNHLRPTLKSREQLVTFITDLRTRYPFLQEWRLFEVSQSWDASHLSFASVAMPNGDELGLQNLPEISLGTFHAEIPTASRHLNDLFSYLSGGITNDHQFAIEPIHGVQLSDWALIYMASHLLSTLVRYRPQIWVHSIRGRAFEGRPMDDRCLAIIEKFLDHVSASFPSLVIAALQRPRSPTTEVLAGG